MTGLKVLPNFGARFGGHAARRARRAQAQDQAGRLSIVVDKSCQIQPESDPLILGDHVDAFRDDAICHLESVLSSHHIEEKITDGEQLPLSLSSCRAGIRRANSD